MDTKPKQYYATLQFEPFVYEKTREEFEASVDLEIGYAMKDLKLYIMDVYDGKNPNDRYVFHPVSLPAPSPDTTNPVKESSP